MVFLKKIFPCIFFTFILFLLLTYPSLTLTYASYGLNIWYKNMIPTLLPMMIVTSCMIKLNITESFSSIIHPITNRLFHLSKNGTYILFTGFLCGFPMGAKVICDLYLEKKISKSEANALLPICNNIGPIFLLTYGLKRFATDHIYVILILFYTIPLCYAFFTLRKKFFTNNFFQSNKQISFSSALDDSIAEGAKGMLSLGGYLMFFNILLIIPNEFISLPTYIKSFLSCFLEITNGLSYPTVLPPFFYLSLLQFGGLCCIFQTLKYTVQTDLSFKSYLLHKINLSIITFLFFFVYYCVFFYDVWNDLPL